MSRRSTPSSKSSLYKPGIREVFGLLSEKRYSSTSFLEVMTTMSSAHYLPSLVRSLTGSSNGRLVTVIVSITLPEEQSDGIWTNSYTISTDGTEWRQQVIAGYDAVQALVGCLKCIEADLIFRKKFSDLQIDPPIDGQPGFGFWPLATT